MDKIITIKADIHNEYEADIFTKEYSNPKNLIIENLSFFVSEEITEALLSNSIFVSNLEKLGYVNKNDIKIVNENVTYLPEIYCMSSFRNEKVNLNSLSDIVTEELASNRAILVQRIDMNSLSKINKKAHKQITSYAKKRAQKLKRRKELSKERKIEQAKKVLKENGIISDLS